MEKIIAVAIKNGNSIFKNYRYKEIRDVIDTIIGLMPKEEFSQNLLMDYFPELMIVENSSFNKDTSFEAILLDGKIHFIPYEEEGFIDKNGMFLNRNEAFTRALQTNQMIENVKEKFSYKYQIRELTPDMIIF